MAVNEGKGELTRLERDVVESLAHHELISRDLEREFEYERLEGPRIFALR